MLERVLWDLNVNQNLSPTIWGKPQNLTSLGSHILWQAIFSFSSHWLCFFWVSRKLESQKFSLEWNGCKIKMDHLKNMAFYRIVNLNSENYHNTNNLTVSQKISLTWSISLRVTKHPLLNFWICSTIFPNYECTKISIISE